jgi:hypothetical protein
VKGDFAVELFSHVPIRSGMFKFELGAFIQSNCFLPFYNDCKRYINTLEETESQKLRWYVKRIKVGREYYLSNSEYCYVGKSIRANPDELPDELPIIRGNLKSTSAKLSAKDPLITPYQEITVSPLQYPSAAAVFNLYGQDVVITSHALERFHYGSDRGDGKDITGNWLVWRKSLIKLYTVLKESLLAKRQGEENGLYSEEFSIPRVYHNWGFILIRNDEDTAWIIKTAIKKSFNFIEFTPLPFTGSAAESWDPKIWVLAKAHKERV